jgi:hypothetical protein
MSCFGSNEKVENNSCTKKVINERVIENGVLTYITVCKSFWPKTL